MSLLNPLGMRDNRTHYIKTLNQLILSSKNQQHTLGLLIVQLSRLRDINRIYGFEVGDILVEHFINHTQQIIRDQDKLFQLSDDEFAIALPELFNPAHAELAVNRLLDIHSASVKINDTTINAGIIIGMTLRSTDTDTAQQLTQQAQSALKFAQNHHLNHANYHDHIDTHKIAPLKIENLLREAIANTELIIHYQPKISLQTGKVSGVEALSRWHTSEYGAISPQIFIELAEQSDLIIGLTTWTLNTAMRQFSSLLPHYPKLTLSINLSATLLHYPHLINIIQRSLRTWHFPPQNLILEITESAVMADPTLSQTTLVQLRNQGLMLSIDDFGTGYSSFAYLRRLPVGELKIDKSFITDICNSHEDYSIVQAVTRLGHTFGLIVVAEGIEQEDTLVTLKQLGCNSAQGYFIAKPMDIKHLKTWLSSHI